MFQLQAEHRHAAGLIDLLFKFAFQLLCHTSRLLKNTSKNTLLCKRLYRTVARLITLHAFN